MEMLTRDSRILVGGGREEIHPLFNFGILRNIFHHFDVKTLTSVRETCSFWNEEAHSLLQNRSKITITWPWYKDMDVNRKPTLPTFMKYVESVKPENVFFRNYRLYDWRLHSNEEEMTQFWLKCGQHIRNLTLKSHDFGFYEQSYVQNVFFNWTPNMESLQIENVRFMNYPNYKPLDFMNMPRDVRHIGEYEPCRGEQSERKIESDDLSTLEPMKKCEIRENIQPNYNFHTLSMGHVYPNFPLQWKELFVSYPNLKGLSVKPLYHKEGVVHNLTELLTDLIEYQEENPDKLQNLKHLDLFSQLPGDYAVANAHFEQAMKLKFKLESLRISLRELNYDIIGKYIAKLSPTFKTLEIKCDFEALTVFPPPGKKMSFPKLKNLTIGLDALSSNNVDFLEKTPILEKLTIGGDMGSYARDREPQLFLNTITMLPLDSLRHLHVNVNILTEDCVRKIGEWFPNLSHFGAILDDKLLWAVYKYLCNSLEELDIYGKGVTDAGITGMERMEGSSFTGDKIEPNQCKSSSSKESESQEHPVKRCKFNDTENRKYIGTSIGKMKKLRHITISGKSYIPDTERVQLTDDSVYNGFILLTELTYLGFKFCENSITEESYRSLCSRRNIITLDTTRFYRGYGIKKTGTLHDLSAGFLRLTKIEI